MTKYKLRHFQADDAIAIKDHLVRGWERNFDGAWDHSGWMEVASYSGLGFTGLRDGRILACSGVIPQWEGRATAWVLMCRENSRTDLLWITRGISEFLDRVQAKADNGAWSFGRVDTTVSEDFEPGHHLMRLLGFQSEGLLRSYTQLGQDQRMYSRIASWYKA